MKGKIALSACLLGLACKYDGTSNLDPVLISSLRGWEIIPVCPEILGGMPTPRVPSEIQSDGRIKNQIGEDVTAYFERGMTETLAILRRNGCERIILKDGSPSCGFLRIYDGTFSHRKIPGMGITAKYLHDNGITIVDIHEKGQR